MRVRFSFVLAGVALAVASASAQGPDPREMRDALRHALPRAYHGRDAEQEQTDRFSARYRIGRDGRVSVSNISGDITVTGGSGDEVAVEAVKRGRRDRSQLDQVRIEVDNAPGRVDVRTSYPRFANNNNVSVDFTVTVPSGISVEVHSVSGSVKVTGVRGVVRAESVSGNVSATDTPKLELAKSVSGDVTFSGVSTDTDVSIGSVSGSVRGRSVKAHGLDFSSVSGDVIVSDATCDRFGAKSVSGAIEYSGTITRSGRYDMNSHSGGIRLTLTNPPGFEVTANTFSGSIRSDFPLTIGGDSDRRGGPGITGRSIRATFGDGSATLTLRTFSGNIVIEKR
jgi:DUF4097 and DUF4098 domain-containing protein YvlB